MSIAHLWQKCERDEPPNGLPISRRPPGALHELPSKTERSRAPKAVGCMGVFGDPVAVVRVATRIRRPHS